MSHIRNFFRRRMVFSAAFVLLLSLALCGCGSGSQISTPINYQGDGTSGLRGVVTGYGNSVGPTPVPLAGATVSAYLNAPRGNPTIEVVSGFGPLVGQTQTDAQGNYSLPLIPGFYLIGVTSTNAAGNAGSGGGAATITAHQFVQLNPVVNYGSP